MSIFPASIPGRPASPPPTNSRRQQYIREDLRSNRIFNPNWSIANPSTDSFDKIYDDNENLHQRALEHVRTTERNLITDKYTSYPTVQDREEKDRLLRMDLEQMKLENDRITIDDNPTGGGLKVHFPSGTYPVLGNDGIDMTILYRTVANANNGELRSRVYETEYTPASMVQNFETPIRIAMKQAREKAEAEGKKAEEIDEIVQQAALNQAHYINYGRQNSRNREVQQMPISKTSQDSSAKSPLTRKSPSGLRQAAIPNKVHKTKTRESAIVGLHKKLRALDKTAFHQAISAR
jgi:hypothetical protein